jgi:hypothetical protein
MNTGNAISPAAAMLQLLVGAWVSQAIYVAAKLSIADLLRERPLTIAELAAATGANEGALFRILRALSSLGVFEEHDERRFALTPLADCLRSDVPGSLRAFAIMLGEKEHRGAWDNVLHSVRTGEPAFDHVFGAPHFHYFASNPEAARVFNEGMTSRAGAENAAIVEAYDFSKFRTVIDVGGGQGTLLTAIKRTAADTGTILFDLPHVISAGQSASTTQGHETASGNFFEFVPQGGDAYVLKKVIHDWDDDRAVSILKNCRVAMNGMARLLLIEPVVPSGNAASFNKLVDLMMLVWTSGGKERTENEHRALLAVAGFTKMQFVPTDCSLTIIEAM